MCIRDRGKSASELSALVAGVEPSAAMPLFLPHLEGERAPIWDSASRGVFARLDGRTGAPEMARAVMEGVSFSLRWAFEALQQSTGSPVEIAKIGGGGSRSDVWTQIKADILGFPLRRAAVPNSAAIGAAILAGVGSGVMPSLPDAIRSLIQFDRTFEPQRSFRTLYDDRFAHYRDLYETLRPFNDKFA